VLFVCVTGEEKGLLGSYFYSRRPTVPMASIVADLNVDMVLPIIPLEDLVVHGEGESELGDLARADARAAGIAVLPDPEPQRNLFIRSDQFNFIRAGVPAIAFSAAATPGSPEDSTLHAWTRARYHQPSDDLAQPMLPGAAADLIRYLTRLTADVANAPARPRWKDTSFFKPSTGGPAGGK
jgi:Zn-dependent M28 family amino/carboxypeptidase